MAGVCGRPPSSFRDTGQEKRPAGGGLRAGQSLGLEKGGFSRRNRGGARLADRPCVALPTPSTPRSSSGFPPQPPESRWGGKAMRRSPAPKRRGSPCGSASWNARRDESWLLTSLIVRCRPGLAGRLQEADSQSGRPRGAIVICSWRPAPRPGVFAVLVNDMEKPGARRPAFLGLLAQMGPAVRPPAALPPWPRPGSCRGRARRGRTSPRSRPR